MKKLIKFNAKLSYQYYTEDGKFMSAEDVIEKLAAQAGVEIIKEGNGVDSERNDSMRKETL